MQCGFDVPICVLQKDHINQQQQINDNLYRSNVVNKRCIIGSEEYPDLRKNCDNAIEKSSQTYDTNVFCSKQFVKDKILQPYTTQKDFTISNNYPEDNPSYNFYVFDIRHYQDFSSAQPTKVSFDFRPSVVVALKLIDYAPLLTNKTLKISSDEQRQLDLT